MPVPLLTANVVADRHRNLRGVGIPLCADAGWTEAAEVQIQLDAPAHVGIDVFLTDVFGTELGTTVVPAGARGSTVSFPAGLAAGSSPLTIGARDGRTEPLSFQTVSVEELARELVLSTARECTGGITARSPTSYLLTLPSQERLQLSLAFSRSVPEEPASEAVPVVETEVDSDSTSDQKQYRRSWFFRVFSPFEFPSDEDDQFPVGDLATGETGDQIDLRPRARSAVLCGLEYRSSSIRWPFPIRITRNLAPWHRHLSEVPLQFQTRVAFWCPVGEQTRLASRITPEMAAVVAALFDMGEHGEAYLDSQGLHMRAIIDRFVRETPVVWLDQVRAAWRSLNVLTSGHRDRHPP